MRGATTRSVAVARARVRARARGDRPPAAQEPAAPSCPSRSSARCRPRRTAWPGRWRSSRGRSRAGRSWPSTSRSRGSRRWGRGPCRRARPRHPRPGLRVPRAAPTSASASRRRRPRTSASSCSSSPTTRSRRSKVSPKIVELFNSVKRALVGYLAVSSQPAGARVTLVGAGGARTDLGLTDFFPLEVLAGEYTVEVAPAGLPDGDAAGEHRRARPPRPLERRRSCASWRASSSSPSRRASRSGSTASCARPRRQPRARARTRRRARAGSTPRRPRRAPRSRTSRSAATRSSCAGSATRRSSARSTPRQPQDYEVEPGASSRTRSPRCASPPTRPGARIFLNGEARGVTPGADRRHLLGQACASR